LDLGELSVLDVCEVPGVLLERVSRALDGVLLLGFGGAPLLSPNVVERIMCQPLDVEAVEDDPRLRRRGDASVTALMYAADRSSVTASSFAARSFPSSAKKALSVAVSFPSRAQTTAPRS